MIIDFPSHPSSGRAVRTDASMLDVLRGRIRLLLGRMLNAIHVPGVIQDMAIVDELTGQDVEITVSPLFVKLTINGRDYYFDRITGRFDGTGIGCG